MRVGLAGTGRIGVLHAANLCAHPEVSELILTDVDLDRAQSAAKILDGAVTVADSVDALFACGVDALVVATSTDTHAELILRSVRAGVPVFCEKPISAALTSSREVVDRLEGTDVPVQLGFQRRFDTGYMGAREAVESGRTGWVHTLRATTLDPAPPEPEYIPRSGGIFTDCSVHDFDIIRWVTGAEVSRAYGIGSNRGADFFAAAGDVDTAAAILQLDDGALALVSSTRYNGAGCDVRLEVLGSKDSISVGLDDHTPLRSAEPGVSWPAGRPPADFMERFHEAYLRELDTFIDVAAGRVPSPCTPQDALEALLIAQACELARREQRSVEIAEMRS
jgi:myo-inositol 2-dehydrogenase/D-chiro-inositol 1-dehydrogenase